MGQAKDYAERLNIRYTYATNGLKIYGIDMDEGTEGDVDRYPTPDELWEMTFPHPKNPTKRKLLTGKHALKRCPLRCSWANFFHVTFSM